MRNIHGFPHPPCTKAVFATSGFRHGPLLSRPRIAGRTSAPKDKHNLGRKGLFLGRAGYIGPGGRLLSNVVLREALGHILPKKTLLLVLPGPWLWVGNRLRWDFLCTHRLNSVALEAVVSNLAIILEGKKRQGTHFGNASAHFH